MAIAPTIRVTDESTAAELAEALGFINAKAKRTQYLVGPVTYGEPTEWDKRHELLNAMLTDWQARV